MHSIHKKSREVFKASVSNDFLEYYHVEEGCRGWGEGLMHLVEILSESLGFSFKTATLTVNGLIFRRAYYQKDICV